MGFSVFTLHFTSLKLLWEKTNLYILQIQMVNIEVIK